MGPQGRQVRALKATLFRRPDLLGLCVLGRKHSHVIPGTLFPGTVLCITTSPLPLGVLRSRTLQRLQDWNILRKKKFTIALSPLQTGPEVVFQSWNSSLKEGWIGFPQWQWLGIHLPMQGPWVWSVVQEDPTCRGMTKPVCHNYWSPHTLEPLLHKRSLCDEKPVHRS